MRRRRPTLAPLTHAGITAACMAAGAATIALRPSPALAQQKTQPTTGQIRDSQLRLEQIRREREQLQSQMKELQSRVRDVSAELANIDKQVSSSNNAIEELNFQATAVEANVTAVSADLVRSRDLLRERTVLLDQRLRSIYERGPLHSVEVLLTAHTFGELLNRYKYLHLVATHDRALVRDIGTIEARLTAQEQELRDQRERLRQVLDAREGEVAQLERAQAQRQQTLRTYRSRQEQTKGRIETLDRDSRRLTSLIAELEKRRREEERRRSAAGAPAKAGTITTRDLGALDWPVEGRLVYRFGPERKANGVVLRWNGVGIGADAGTPVKSVEAGTVVLAGSFEGYGPSVMISHGGGYYTLYLYLDRIDVKENQQVKAGQVIGTVGGAMTPEGPHLEFQVRAPVNGAPVAVDPLSWLRARSGS